VLFVVGQDCYVDATTIRSDEDLAKRQGSPRERPDDGLPADAADASAPLEAYFGGKEIIADATGASPRDRGNRAPCAGALASR
jgi:hypothetical protein